MRATTCENFPVGFFAVPLNIRCSRKCARPDFAGRLVGRADLVPDHVRDDRRTVVGDHDQLQAIRQREVGDFRARRFGGQCRHCES